MGSVPLLIVWAMFTLPPITVSVYPAHAFVPATFRITVLAPRHVDNRKVCYSADGPELKKSCFTLNGAEDRRVWTVYWNLRAPGEYTAIAELTRVTDGTEKIYRSSQPFRVIGAELP